MKDVISVDTILAGVFLEGAEVPKTDNPDKDLDVYMERSEYHIPIAQANLHSLLISKLPEKKEGTIQLESYSETDIDQIEEDMKVVVTYRLGFNKAVDDMHRVIDEMFGVGDE